VGASLGGGRGFAHLQEVGKLIGGKWPAEELALPFGAALDAQIGPLLVR
jgi:hypothetical protein